MNPLVKFLLRVSGIILISFYAGNFTEFPFWSFVLGVVIYAIPDFVEDFQRIQ